MDRFFGRDSCKAIRCALPTSASQVEGVKIANTRRKERAKHAGAMGSDHSLLTIDSKIRVGSLRAHKSDCIVLRTHPPSLLPQPRGEEDDKEGDSPVTPRLNANRKNVIYPEKLF